MSKQFLFGLFTIFLLSFTFNTAIAQDKNPAAKKNKHGQNFVDKNGDGYNDNAPDHDGDGIPNGLDPDWQKLQKSRKKHHFVDLNGDGIDDNLQNKGNKEHARRKGKQQMQNSGNTADGQMNQQRHGQRQKHGRH